MHLKQAKIEERNTNSVVGNIFKSNEIIKPQLFLYSAMVLQIKEIAKCSLLNR